MARGDFTLFEELALTLGTQNWNLANGGNTVKVGLIKIAATPTAADGTPTWGDYSANEVSGSNYSAGGATLASQQFTEASGTATFDADDVTWSQHASGFAVGASTGAAWGIVYNSTDASSRAIGFVELKSGSTTVGNVDGDLTISWNASGIFTVDA